MKYACLVGFIFLLLIGCSLQAVSSSPGAVAATATTSSSADPVINQTVYMGASYQAYIDNISLPAATSSFNITFALMANDSMFSAAAYGPDNQPLTVNITYPSQSYASVIVSTPNITNFNLVTILEGMTYLLQNYTTYVNFYPITNENYTTSTTTYLPAGSQYLNYSNSQSLSEYTSGTTQILNGTGESSLNSTIGSVTYAGNYQLAEVSSFNRLFEIGTSSILVQDTLVFNNTGYGYSGYPDSIAYYTLSTITINTPPGATGLSVGDNIGSLSYVNNGNGTITVTLRNSITFGQAASITLYYSLPLSSMITSSNGRTVLSSSVVPSWLDAPVRQSTVTILMPLGSTNPQMVGAQTLTTDGHPAVTASYSLLTQYTNQFYTLSYTPSLIWPYLELIIIIVLAAIVVVSYTFYKLVWKRRGLKKDEAPVTTATNPPKTPSKA